MFNNILRKTFKVLFEWFKNNLINVIYYQFCEDAIVRVNEYDVRKSESEKLLGIKFETKLTFENHMRDICNKASQKICALARVTPYVDLFKKRILMNAFFNSRFNYWMRHNRTTNRKVNRLHERCLRIIYNGEHSSFEELLEEDDFVATDNKNIEYLAVSKIYLSIKIVILQFATRFSVFQTSC